MRDAKPFTRADLTRSLCAKLNAVVPVICDADDYARWITEHGLTDVIAGRHDGKPVTFAKGFELVFGERLTLKGAA